MKGLRVGICGPPSAGKTTMANRLRRLIYSNCECVKEYARHYIERYGPPTEVSEQMWILDGQKKWEDQAAKTYEVVISDSPLFLSYIYGRMLADVKDRKGRGFLVRLYELAIEGAQSYDVVYILPPRAVRSDGVRTQSDEDSKNIYDLIKSFCDDHRIEYHKVPAGGYDEQAEWVAKHLNGIYSIPLRP